MMGNDSTSRAIEGIAVIIAARNAADTIGQAVRSALAQPEVVEIAVIDDGSQDDTLAAARAVDDGSGRLILRKLPKSIGPGEARNIAIGATTAPLICILDADDYFLPGRMGKLLAYLEDFDFVADDLYRQTLGREDEPYTFLIGDIGDTPRVVDFDKFIEGNIARSGVRRHEMGFLKPLVRRSFLVRYGLAYEPGVRLGEDFILYATALAWGARFKITPPCGYISIEHDGSLSRDHTVEDLAAVTAATERLMHHPRLSSSDQRILGVFLNQLHQRLHYRQVLAAKRKGGMMAAGVRLLSAPQHLLYILGETAKARLKLKSP